MKMFVLFVLAVSAMKSAYAGKETGNGGDVNALDSYDIALAVATEISREPAKYPEIAIGSLDRLIRETKFLVSETALFIETLAVRQEVVAINYKNPHRIVISRQKWQELKESEKKSLIFHELLGLMDLESTGDYRISSRYFAANNVDLYDCFVYADPASTELEFTMSSVSRGTWFDIIVNGQITEKFYLRISPGHIKDSSASGKPDSEVLVLERLKRGANDWERSQNVYFFGRPNLPDSIHVELDRNTPTNNDLILQCDMRAN